MSSIKKIGTYRGLVGTRTLDQRLPARRRDDSSEESPQDDLRHAFAQLKKAAKDIAADMELELDEELEVVLVITKEHGKRRILRRIPLDEVLRLSQLLKSGRQQLIDQVI